MNNHTPGPWRLGKNGDDVVADEPAGHNSDAGALNYYGGHLVAESICGKNRDLIAMAPQILLALEDAAGIFRGLVDDIPLLRQRVEAYDNLIAKARGDQ